MGGADGAGNSRVGATARWGGVGAIGWGSTVGGGGFFNL